MSNYFFASDSAWNPSVPVGHSNFSWPEEDGSPVEAVIPPQRQPEVKHDEVKEVAPKQKRDGGNPEQKKEGGKDKKQKGGDNKKGGKEKEPAAAPAGSPFARVELRVGKILKAAKHENADKLFIESIDVGEAEPRQIVSGLVGHYSAEELTGHRVVVITNLKPSPLVKVVSYGMVLAAKADVNGKQLVQLVEPPEGAKVGERVFVEGEDLSGAPDDKIDAKKAGNAVCVEC